MRILLLLKLVINFLRRSGIDPSLQGRLTLNTDVVFVFIFFSNSKPWPSIKHVSDQNQKSGWRMKKKKDKEEREPQLFVHVCFSDVELGPNTLRLACVVNPHATRAKHTHCS